MKKWEYISLYVDIEDSWIAQLNDFGREGWELIQAERWTNGRLFIFKREITDEN